VVVDVDPVAHVGAGSVELGLDALEDPRDLTGDELLDVLPRPVVVGAVGQRGLDAEGPDPGAHQQVGAGLGRRVGRRGVHRRGLGEPVRVVELEVAVDLVGRDVVDPLAVLADRLEQPVGTDDVGLHERPRVVQAVVVVRLGGEVDDHVGVRDEAVDERLVGDGALLDGRQ
jgi:hypothetical protein